MENIQAPIKAAPKFSIVLIVKDEEKVLARALDSLKEFQERGGEVVILDTGSKTTETIEIAEKYGCKVHINTSIPRIYMTDEEVAEVNSRFVSEGEAPLAKIGDSFFNFSAARNMVNSFASNDFVFTMDADEVYTVFNIDRINELIEAGAEQFEYQFVYAHNPDGSPSVQYKQIKAFDRRKVVWKGIVHEHQDGAANSVYLQEWECKLEHWQEFGKEHRKQYLLGLAYDVMKNPDNDRHSHYLGREMQYQGRPASAIKELKRHIEMNKWHQERAESWIFMGDAYSALNDAENQRKAYHEAFNTDSQSRRALMKLAYYYKYYENWQAALCYAKAAMEIPDNGFYGIQKVDYKATPYHISYVALGFLGRVGEAAEYNDKALEFEPYNAEFLRDTQFYNEYAAPQIEGWMRWPEIKFLYNQAKLHDTIVEVGSFKGRSSHALLMGALKGKEGTVTCVDTWLGSTDPKDATYTIAKQEDLYAAFMKNVGFIRGLKVNRKSSVEAAKDYEDNSIDFVFIDAGHDFTSVTDDILSWSPKCKKILAGHDYTPDVWMRVVEAVDNIFGKPDYVVDSIWVVDLEKRRLNNGISKG